MSRPRRGLAVDALCFALAAACLGGATVITRRPASPRAPLERAPADLEWLASNNDVARNEPREAASAGLPDAFDRDDALASSAPDVASYRLHADLDLATHDMRGRGVIRFRNASRKPVDELFFHLYLNGFKSPDTVFLRTPIGRFRGGGRIADFGRIDVKRLFARELGVDLWPGATRADPAQENDETDMRVPLPSALEPGEALTLEVEWASHLPSVKMRTGHFGDFHMVAQWYPKLAKLEESGEWAHFAFHPLAEFYADFGSYDVTLDVPAGVPVAATGSARDPSAAADPAPPPPGPGRTTLRFVQRNVHDFAFAAWPSFEVARAKAGDVDVACFYPRGYGEAGRVELQTAVFALEHFGARYGRYPHETLTLVHPPSGAPEAGGMEYPTLVTTGGDWWAPTFDVRPIENVTVHEVGHQWFQGMVATNEIAWPFLDEGVNSFVDAGAVAARYGEGGLASALGFELSLEAAYHAGSRGKGGRAPIAQSATAFEGGDLGALVYARTAALLASLDRAYEPGAVTRHVGRYARQNRFRHPTPDDFMREVGGGIAPSAERVLRAGLFERGEIDYAVESVEPSDVGATVTLVRRGELAMPVDVVFAGARGGRFTVRWDGRPGELDVATYDRPQLDERARVDARALEPEAPLGDEARLVVRVSGGALASVAVDPGRRLLVDDDLVNNAWRADPARAAPRVWARLGVVAGALSAVLAP